MGMSGHKHPQTEGIESEKPLMNMHDVDRSGSLAPHDARLILSVLAFIVPYLLQVSYVMNTVSVRLYAPLWVYGSIDNPTFRVLFLDYLVVELPFGIVKLLFIQQIYRYMTHQTTFCKVLFYGIATEIPGTVFAYVLSVASIMTPFYSPVPIILALGLFFAVRTPKKSPTWIEERKLPGLLVMNFECSLLPQNMCAARARDRPASRHILSFASIASV